MVNSVLLLTAISACARAARIPALPRYHLPKTSIVQTHPDGRAVFCRGNRDYTASGPPGKCPQNLAGLYALLRVSAPTQASVKVEKPQASIRK